MSGSADDRQQGADDRGRRRKPRRPPPGVEERAAAAVAALRALGRALAEERGLGAGERLPMDAVELAVTVPLGRADRGVAEEARALAASLDRAVGDAIRAHGAFQQGRVYCFLCDRPDCDHARPAPGASTFAGYAPNGRPEWISFTNLCLARGEERVDRLYGEDAEVIALTLSAAELQEGLLPGFGRDDLAWRLLGQVVAGLVPRDLSSGGTAADRVALTFQLVETRDARAGGRLRLNVLGLTPEELAEAAGLGDARGPGEALRRTLRATRHRVDALGRRAAAARRGEPVDLEAQASALLGRLRGDVERVFRPVRRRTQHAQQRHEEGDRPTGHAMSDVANASDDRLLRDARSDAIIVLGGRGRAHVFSPAGQHVTSMRLRPGELDRKLGRSRWEPLDVDRARAFRARLAGVG